MFVESGNLRKLYYIHRKQRHCFLLLVFLLRPILFEINSMQNIVQIKYFFRAELIFFPLSHADLGRKKNISPVSWRAYSERRLRDDRLSTICNEDVKIN